jgi:hypothetical protein
MHLQQQQQPNPEAKDLPAQGLEAHRVVALGRQHLAVGVVAEGGDVRVLDHGGLQVEAPVRHEYDGVAVGQDGGRASKRFPCKTRTVR